jgi:DNA replication protein DnaC
MSINNPEDAAEAQKRLEEKRKELGIDPNAKATEPFDRHIQGVMARMAQREKDMTPEERTQREHERAQMEELTHRELFETANCPLRHQKATTLERSGQWGAVEKHIAGRMGTGFLVALVGIRGSGKTQLAVEIIRRNAYKHHRRSQFCSAMEFFMEVKAGYKDEGAPEKEVLEKFCKPSLLVIDEMGKRSDTEWENRLLYELINRRYNALRDTLIISNQEAKELEAALGPSIVSRMRETGGIIECNWDSYRK